MFPVKHDDIWQMYKKQVDCFWRAEEIDLTKDMDSWKTLTDNERYFIKMWFGRVDNIKIYNVVLSIKENCGPRCSLSYYYYRNHRAVPLSYYPDQST